MPVCSHGSEDMELLDWCEALERSAAESPLEAEAAAESCAAEPLPWVGCQSSVEVRADAVAVDPMPRTEGCQETLLALGTAGTAGPCTLRRQAFD